jgi:hypothetical protein
MTTKTEKRIAFAVLVGLLALMAALSNAHAQTPISGLPAGAALTGTEEIPAVQSAATVKTTAAAIGTLARGGAQTTVSLGGTGQAALANDALFMGNGTGAMSSKAIPSCSGASNALTYNVTTDTWGCNTIAGGGTPGGSNTQVQYNNAGAFAGSSNLAWDNTNRILTVGAATDGTIASASGVPLVIGNSAGNTSLTLRAAGSSNMLFQQGGSTRMTLDSAQTAVVVGTGWHLIGGNGGSIQTNNGNFIAQGGTYFARTGSSVSSLGFAFNDDTNTGIYGAANDTVNFACNGANCGTISASLPVGSSGSTTTGWTGCTGGPTNNLKYARNGAVVTIGLDATLTCTSNGTTFVATSTLGTLYRPVADVVFSGLQVTDNGTNRPGCMRLTNASGAIEFGLYDNTTAACSFNTWTNTGTKAFLATGTRYWTYTAH